MCVIVIGNKKSKSSAEDLRRMEAANKDGAGIAWQTKDGRVRWSKGLRADEVAKLLHSKHVGSAWVAHFRWATVGGASAELTHPFVIDRDATTATEGEAERVLFHNGHWGEWATHAQGVSRAIEVSLPDGPMSDSRAAAWIAAQLGEQFLDLLPGKWVVLDKNGARRFGSGWSERHDGTSVSNTNWLSWESPCEGVAPMRASTRTMDYDAWMRHAAEESRAATRAAEVKSAAAKEVDLVMEPKLVCKSCGSKGGGRNPIGVNSGLCLGCIHKGGRVPRKRV